MRKTDKNKWENLQILASFYGNSERKFLYEVPHKLFFESIKKKNYKNQIFFFKSI